MQTISQKGSKWRLNFSNEGIIFTAKRTTFKFITANLFAFILLGIFWYFMGPKIFVKLGIIGVIITICVFTFLIIDTIDLLFLSKLILTNKRLIKRRYLRYSNVLLSEIESITLNQTLDFGFIYIVSKNGTVFQSPIIANPSQIKMKIEKYLVDT